MKKGAIKATARKSSQTGSKTAGTRTSTKSLASQTNSRNKDLNASEIVEEIEPATEGYYDPDEMVIIPMDSLEPGEKSYSMFFVRTAKYSKQIYRYISHLTHGKLRA